MRYWCNLVAKKSELECTHVNDDDFTVLVSGGSRCCWVTMYTGSPSHLKWLSKYSNKCASNFALSFNILPWKLFGWFRRAQLWATGDWQIHHNQLAGSCITSHDGKTSNQPGDSAPLQPRFGALRLLAFPKTIRTFEREEISDHRWDSGK